MSIYWPLPRALARRSAARIATAAYMPVMRSVIATPAFCGPPPGQIVALAGDAHEAAMPWMMKS